MKIYLQLFKNKIFRDLTIAEIINELGDWIVILAIQSLLVYEYNSGPWIISLLFIFSILPRVIFSPISGVILDKYHRTKVLLYTRFCSFLICTLLFFASSGFILIGLICFLNIFITFNFPASIGIARSTLEDKEVDNGIGLLYFISDLMKVLAPLIAAFLIGIVKLNYLFLISAGLLFISLLLVFRLNKSTQLQQNKITVDKSSNVLAEIIPNLKESLAHILKVRMLLLSFLVVSIFVFSINSIETSVIFFVESLSEDPKYFSFFMSSIGLGGAIGALIILKLIDIFSKMLLSFTCMIISGLLMLFLPLVNNIYIGLIMALIIGIFVPGIIIPIEIVKQNLTDKSMSSRIASFTTSIQNFFQLLGAASAGFLISILGPSGSFIVAGLLILVSGCISILIYLKENKVINNQYSTDK